MICCARLPKAQWCPTSWQGDQPLPHSPESTARQPGKIGVHLPDGRGWGIVIRAAQHPQHICSCLRGKEVDVLTSDDCRPPGQPHTPGRVSVQQERSVLPILTSQRSQKHSTEDIFLLTHSHSTHCWPAFHSPGLALGPSDATEDRTELVPSLWYLESVLGKTDRVLFSPERECLLTFKINVTSKSWFLAFLEKTRKFHSHLASIA